jgi:hypothetical protein
MKIFVLFIALICFNACQSDKQASSSSQITERKSSYGQAVDAASSVKSDLEERNEAIDDEIEDLESE